MISTWIPQIGAYNLGSLEVQYRSLQLIPTNWSKSGFISRLYRSYIDECVKYFILMPRQCTWEGQILTKLCK